MSRDGSVVIENEDKCIALVRNAGINAAKGREKNLKLTNKIRKGNSNHDRASKNEL